MLHRSTEGLDGTNPTTIQAWTIIVDRDIGVGPNPTLLLPVGASQGSTLPLVVQSGLYHCYTTCVLVATGTWSGPSVPEQTEAAIVMEGEPTIVKRGERIELRISVPAASGADAHIGFDGGPEPARIVLG